VLGADMKKILSGEPPAERASRPVLAPSAE
jgi:hypothetical protein